MISRSVFDRCLLWHVTVVTFSLLQVFYFAPIQKSIGTFEAASRRTGAATFGVEYWMQKSLSSTEVLVLGPSFFQIFLCTFLLQPTTWVWTSEQSNSDERQRVIHFLNSLRIEKRKGSVGTESNLQVGNFLLSCWLLVTYYFKLYPTKSLEAVGTVLW